MSADETGKTRMDVQEGKKLKIEPPSLFSSFVKKIFFHPAVRNEIKHEMRSIRFFSSCYFLSTAAAVTRASK